MQKDIFISIENLTLPPNPEVYPYSTFDIVVRSIDGTALERFSNLTMDENNIASVNGRFKNAQDHDATPMSSILGSFELTT